MVNATGKVEKSKSPTIQYLVRETEDGHYSARARALRKQVDALERAGFKRDEAIRIAASRGVFGLP